MIGRYHLSGLLKNFVKDKNNKRIIDFKLNNLHLVSYSIPINKYLTKTKLFKKLNTLKKISLSNSIFNLLLQKGLGFCITENFKKKIDKKYSKKDKFHVKIESKLDKRATFIMENYSLKVNPHKKS